MAQVNVIDEKWQQMEQLGEGGQAWAFKVKAVDDDPSGFFVLKKLKNRNRIERFKQEVEALSAITHPNVVQIVAFNLDLERPYFVTELCEGGSLEQAQPFKFSSIPRIFDIFGQICNGVLAAHEKGVIHRDLKPANIFLRGSKQGDAVVGDFGLCLTEDTPRLTETSEAVGPRLFIAPELEDGRYEQANEACDVYSLGKLLYWLLSSGITFSREKHRQQLFDLCNITQNSFLEHVNKLLDNMITEDPEGRWPLAKVRRRLPHISTLVEHRYNPLGKAAIALCTYCGSGLYTLVGHDSNSVSEVMQRTPVEDVWRIFACNNCGHTQTFRIDFGSSAVWD